MQNGTSLTEQTVHKANGFTILEVVMTTVILAILAVGMVVAFDKTTFDNQNFAEQLKRDIRLTQNLALNMDASYTITISATSYTISPAPKTFAAVTSIPSGSGITLSSSPSAIVFDSKGKPNSAATITVTNSSGVKTLTLTAETGFIQ
jgi:MSHA pilin protein MshC